MVRTFCRRLRDWPRHRFRWTAALILTSFCLNETAAQDQTATARQPTSPQQVDGVQRKSQEDGAYWMTRWQFDDVDVQKLNRRLRAIGIDMGIALEGNVSVRFEVGVPWKSLNKGSAYRFDGVLTSKELNVDTIRLKDLETRVRYRDGVANLARLQSKLIDDDGGMSGQVFGTAKMELLPRGDFHAELDARELSVASIGQWVERFLGIKSDWLPDTGTLTAATKFRVPVSQLGDLTQYEGDASLAGDNVVIGDLQPMTLAVDDIAIKNGHIKIGQLSAESGKHSSGRTATRILGKAELAIKAPSAFRVELYADDVPMEELASIGHASVDASGTPGIAGLLDLHVEATGRGFLNNATPTWNVEGSVASPDLSFAGTQLGVIEHRFKLNSNRFSLFPHRDLESLPTTFKIKSLEVDYELTTDLIHISNLRLSAFGGQMNATGRIPIDGTGEVDLGMTVRGIRPLVNLPIAGGTPHSVAATLNGDFTWQFPIQSLSKPTAHKANGQLAATRIVLDGKSIGDATMGLTLRNGSVKADAHGRLLSGRFHTQTNVLVDPDDDWSKIPERLNVVEFEIEQLDLARITETLTGVRSDVEGSASGKLVFDFQSNGDAASLPNATVSLEVEQLRYRTKLLSRTLSLKGRVDRDNFIVTSCVGDIASGRMRAKGRITLLDPQKRIRPRADLQVNLARVDLQRAIAFAPDHAELLGGKVSGSGTITGTLESLRVRGNVDGRDLRALSMPVGVAHSNVVANANLRKLQWKIGFPSIRSSVGGGRLEGSLNVESSLRSGVDVKSHWKTRDVDFFRLTHGLGQSTSIASGDISGVLTIGGKSVSSIEDLAGRFDFQLEQTRGAAIPGLTAASEFLGPISLATESFDRGGTRGIIQHGVVIVDEFWLSSSSVLVKSHGKVFLQSGRMELDAMIATGDFRNVVFDVSQFAQRYAINTLIPASTLWSVSELLENRTVVLAVHGTLQNPIIRLRPVDTFREEFTRFLVREGKRVLWMSVSNEAFGGIDDWTGVF